MVIAVQDVELDDFNLPTLKLKKMVTWEGESLQSPEAIYEFFRGLSKKAEEYVYMLAVDTKCHPLAIFEVSHGTVNMSVLNPREIYIRALLAGASSIFLVHNHPSGDVTPSTHDIEITEKLKKCGELLKVELLDHVIVSKHHYFSFRERKYL